MNDFVVIALTEQGASTGRHLVKQLNKQGTINADIYLPTKFANDVENGFGKGQFQQTIQELFKTKSCVICIMATGIVVRSVATVIEDKTVDPAVIVMDEQANHVISLLSGHVGGANEWTQLVSELTQADPVITTATDTEHVQSLDMLAKQLNAWYPNFKENTKLINGKLAAKERVALYIEPYFKSMVDHFRGFTMIDSLDEITDDTPIVVVSDQNTYPKDSRVIQVVPRLNVLGIGCRKGVPQSMMEIAFTKFCDEHHLLWQSFKTIASIDVKKHEAAIQYLAKTLNIPANFFSADELKQVSNNYPGSAFVLKTVGVANVACAAADYASDFQPASERFTEQEITMAFSRMIKL